MDPVRRFVVLLVTVMPLIAGCGSAAPSTVTVPTLVASSASPTVSPTARSASASPTVSPTPRPGQLHIGSLAWTVSDRLLVRSEPRVSDDSIKYQPVLPLGTELLVIGGPVSAFGYVWYEIEPVTFVLANGIRRGWVAMAARDGEPWIALAEPPITPTSPPATASVWTTTGNLIQARKGHTTTLLADGRVLVVGGVGGDYTSGLGLLASAELYDPSSGSWTATGNLIQARADHTATLLADGRVLVVGGNGRSGILASAELYDPGSGSWSSTGNMNGPHVGHTATLLADRRVLVAGNSSNFALQISAELYDPGHGSWTATGNMVNARLSHTATLLLDGTVLVAGGSSYLGIPSAELYDPDSGSWTATGNLVRGHNEHTATLLPDGTVLVVGSFGDRMASAERYDPGSGSWTATGSLIQTRSSHTATLLADGTVLVAGGSNYSDGLLASAELYKLTIRSWTATGSPGGDRLLDHESLADIAASMFTPRQDHTATLLADGTVLVVGGTGRSGEPLASTRLYDPGSRT